MRGIISNDVNVQQRKNRERPGDQMMNHVGLVGIAEQGNHPTKHLVQYASGIHLGIQREARKDLHPTQQNHKKGIRGSTERVVAQVNVSAFQTQVRNAVAALSIRNEHGVSDPRHYTR